MSVGQLAHLWNNLLGELRRIHLLLGTSVNTQFRMLLSRLEVDHLFDHLFVRVHGVLGESTELRESGNRPSKGLYG